MENFFKDDILYIYPSDIIKADNIINHYEPISTINTIFRIESLKMNIMSKHIPNKNHKFNSIIVIIPENKQSFENLIYYNFEDYNYLHKVVGNYIININNIYHENKSKYENLVNTTKKNFEKTINSKEDVCRIENKINKILEFNDWPLDTYYVYENSFNEYIDNNKYYKFKQKCFKSLNYTISNSIVNITPYCNVGFGDFAGRFGNLYCVIKNMGFNIIRNKKYSYRNCNHTDGKESLFTFYDSPFYAQFEENDNIINSVSINNLTLMILLYYDINYVKKILNNNLGCINLTSMNPKYSNILSDIYNNEIYNVNKNRYNAIKYIDKSYFDELKLDNLLIVLHIRLGDAVVRGTKFTYDELINKLSSSFNNKDINLVILSDGVTDKNILNSIDNIQRKDYYYLYDLVIGSKIKKNNCVINIMDIVIGSNIKKDYLCMKYIYYSDYMILPNSTFPILLAEQFNKTKPGGSTMSRSKDNYFINV